MNCPTAARWLIDLGILVVGLSVGSWQCYAQAPGDAAATVRPVDFIRDVQPLLRERCHKCHGGVHRKGELSFLTRADALALLPSGTRAIVPGEPKASELLRRIESSDESERMPPTGDPLTPNEIDVLRRWIAEGARWEQHWSFQPLHRPGPPQVAHSAWVRNAVDRFVLR